MYILRKIFWCSFPIFFLSGALQLSAQVRYADSVIAYSSQYSNTDYSADQVLGAPNTYPKYGDNGTAWASATSDDQREFLELHFPNPAPIQSIAIYETYNPGAIDTIYVKNPNTASWQIVWSGIAAPVSSSDARIFLVNFTQTSFNVDEIRLAINSPAVPGYNEIDAIGISAIQIALHLPDLVVTQIQTPAQAWSGQTISLSWNIKNNGSASTGVQTWSDHLYIMSAALFDISSSVFDEGYDNVSSLDPGQSYLSTHSITLPLGLNGNYYVFIYTDVNHEVAESLEVNNLATFAPMLLHLSPEPDLAVTSVIAPKIAFSGDTIPVAFTVKNVGNAGTGENEWWDQVVISQDMAYNASDVTVLAEIDHTGALPVDSIYKVSASVVIPHNAVGKYYLYVFSDRYNVIYENNFESNNIGRSDSMSVVSVAPDLTVASVTIPSSANSGLGMKVDWTVHNIGVGATYETSWYDCVLLSTAPAYDDGSCETLIRVEHDGALMRDSTYHVTTTAVLPNGISGPYYIYIRTDCNGDVFENGATANNVRRSDTTVSVTLSPWPDLQVLSVHAPPGASAGQPISFSWVEKNTGVTATLNNSWTDRIYISPDSEFNGSAIWLTDVPRTSPLAAGAMFTQSATATVPPTFSSLAYLYVMADADDVVYEYTGESNNITRSDSIVVQQYPPVDLTVTSFTIPDTGISGDTVTVSWTVRNIGKAKTISEYWVDYLYMAADSVFDLDTDQVRGYVEHDGTLDAGAEYTMTDQIILPNDMSGHYYWFIYTDQYASTGDTALQNNVRRSVHPMTMKLLPPPNLTVKSVSTTDTVIVGQPMMVYWTIENIGGGPARNTEWIDAIYLSSDSILDKSDRKLDEVWFNNGPLPALGSYTDSTEITIPTDVAGRYYIIVRTDGRNDVYESNESDNIGFTRSFLQLAPPSDLIVTNVTVPDTVTPGQYISVSYTVRNVGINPAVGYLTDAVFVSQDTMWSVSDPVLGTEYTWITLAPGSSVRKQAKVRCVAGKLDDFTGNVEGELPGIFPGKYRVIVKLNVYKNITESNYSNNTVASATVMNVVVPQLTRDVPYNGFISQDQSEYFSFTASADEDVQIGLASTVQSGFNELFVSYADVPSIGKYDYLYQNQNATNQQITIPSTKAGTYYVLLHGQNVPGDSSDFSLTVKTLHFGIDSIRYSPVGTGGEVEIEILGARFNVGAHAQLRRAGHSPVSDSADDLVNSTHLNARFSTVGLATGAYDVAVINPDSQEAVLPSGLKVDPLDPSQATLSFEGPLRIKVKTTAPMYMIITNPSNVDIERAEILLQTQPDFRLWVETDGSLEDSLPVISSTDSLIDDQGNRFFACFLYNLAPKRSKTVRMWAEPLSIGHFTITASIYVLDGKTFDSLFVVAVKEAAAMGWLTPNGPMSSTSKSSPSPLSVTRECYGDECSIRRDNQRLAQMTRDLAGSTQSCAGLSATYDLSAGGAKNFVQCGTGLMSFYDKYKNGGGLLRRWCPVHRSE